MRPDHSRQIDDALIDQASMDSFPASDPPAYTSVSIGGPSAEQTRVRASPRPQDPARAVAGLQSAYYLVTAIAPLLSRRAFETLTGRKHDWWLVQGVAAAVGAIGASLGLAAMRGPVSPEARALGVASATGLMVVETTYALRGRISRVYLLDALIELALVTGWIGSARQAKRAPE